MLSRHRQSGGYLLRSLRTHNKHRNSERSALAVEDAPEARGIGGYFISVCFIQADALFTDRRYNGLIQILG
jgi:hypothetical protein